MTNDVVIPYTRLEEAIYDTREHIITNLNIAEELYKEYPQSILFISLAYEEVGRYVQYVINFSDEKGITDDDMKELADHKSKLNIPFDNLFERLKKDKSLESINYALNLSFTNISEYHSWLDNKRELSRWLEILPKIKELTTYPSWWGYKTPQPVDLQILMHSNHIYLLAGILFEHCNFYINWMINAAEELCEYPNPRLDENALKFEKERLIKTNQNPKEMDKFRMVNSIIMRLDIIYTAMHDNDYDDESQQIFNEFFIVKKAQEQIMNNDKNC